MRRLVAIAWVVVACAAPAAAQTTQFLPRLDFAFDLQRLSGGDKQFVWDANVGADVDVIALGDVRVGILGNYEVVMGNEFQPFDPNQGNYVFEGTVSSRVARFELSGVFYHQSRHLADRAKQGSISWNGLGTRVGSVMSRGRLQLQARADLRWLFQQRFVDYDWELDSRIRTRVAIRPRVAVISSATVRVLGVNGTRGRGTQTGARGEGGVRFAGDDGGLEVFVAAERRIDPSPVEVGSRSWVTVGFRVSTR